MTFAGRRAAAVLLLVAACGAPPPARLEIGSVTVDPPGRDSAAVARVELRNGGGRDLLLHAARLACGCRLAAALPDVLAPGATTALVVRCRGEARAPERDVRLLSSDPDRPDVAVSLGRPALAVPAVEPPSLYFGYVAVGRSATRDVTLPPGPEGEPRVAADPPLAVEQRPPRADGAHVVRVRFSPVTAGVFRGALALGERGEVVPVSGVGHGNLLPFPAEVTVPSEVTANGAPAIVLKAVGAEPLEIAALELPDGLTGEVQTTIPGREFRITLRARGGRVTAPAAIRVRTTAPDEPVVTIPVRDGTG